MNDKYGKRERYGAAQQQVKNGLWTIDINTGYIHSVFNGGKPIGSARGGYWRVAVPSPDKKYRYVSAHRVVWEYVHGPSDLNLTINHINGDHLDNRISNLELITNQENCIHGHRVLGRANQSRNKGSVNPRAKLVEDQVSVIKKRLRSGENYKVIAVDYGVSPLTIHAIKRGANWKEVE